MIRLEFCGRLRSLAPVAFNLVPKPAAVDTLLELRDWLCVRAPALGEELAGRAIKLVVNDAFIHDLSFPVRDGDEIAFLPPLSGG